MRKSERFDRAFANFTEGNAMTFVLQHMATEQRVYGFIQGYKKLDIEYHPVQKVVVLKDGTEYVPAK